jgi:hypothetical protein
LENRLKFLYALQQVDLGLDEVHDMKGDLPGIVDSLKTGLAEKTAKKHELGELVRKSFAARDATDVDIVTLKEKIDKYKAQQFEVKTNKQYDALAREVDTSQEKIVKLAKEMEQLEGKATVAKQDAEALGPQIETLQIELNERQEELDSVNKEHEEEELRLRHEREKIVVRISKPDLAQYERIRAAKEGKAVVPVKRNSCGGCFNRIPPQTLLELRRNEHMLVCERCGRIIVSDEVADTYASALV